MKSVTSVVKDCGVCGSKYLEIPKALNVKEGSRVGIRKVEGAEVPPNEKEG